MITITMPIWLASAVVKKYKLEERKKEDKE